MLALFLIAALSTSFQDPTGEGPTLEERLRGELPAKLAADARKLGNPARGAIVFHQAHVTCFRCHVGDAAKPPIGPDLSALGKAATDVYLVESILDPSKEIKKGFATVKIATKQGKTLTGLLQEETPDQVVLRDLNADGALLKVARSDIEERHDNGPSSMPTGLVNSLKSRQQFLDLVSYLRAIADGGPDRAKALKPVASLLAPPPLPDYERNLDHAGLIAEFGAGSMARGESIYLRVCSNCHGTKTSEGSMPTSLKFASGMFKNGSDPYSMYKTLTHGFNQMPAQLWMVPRQKYDVIHYIRETYLKDQNKTQYKPIDPSYLAGLPKGTSQGPQAVLHEPWSRMDYGSMLMATYEVGGPRRNFAHKGIALRLDPGTGGVSKGKEWALYDHDTMRLAAFWTGSGFIDWNGINFNGQHGIHPSLVGKIQVETSAGPGWADPQTGSFDDPRLRGRDGNPYGPMPKAWLKYRGLYRNGSSTILAYSVGGTEVLDTVERLTDPAAPETPIISRILHVGPSPRPLTVRLADAKAALALVGAGDLKVDPAHNRSTLTLPASSAPRQVQVLLASEGTKNLQALAAKIKTVKDLTRLTQGGPTQWPQTLESNVASEPGNGPFTVDILAQPASTPWFSQMRFTGLDFLPDGKSLVVCDWDGDVWKVSGLDSKDGHLTWKRIAAGLFQPLGLKVVDGAVYITCRDQIVILRDRNGDGEADFYECFNDDQQVTEHFHEFAMDLQTDAQGNFYYTKGARHALTALVPQHGTLLKVSKDGSKTEILATGFRAPNGVCLNDDGTFYVTDQEGHWTPKNRVNLVRPGKFYGNLWGFTDIRDPSDLRVDLPICWITNAFDRSPSQVIQVTPDSWKPLKGRHLSLSYGYGKIFLVLEESKGDVRQGGLVELPIQQFPTGLIRGRFRAQDGGLYTCGMYAWAGNQQQPGGLYRIRRTSEPLALATQLETTPATISVTFSEPIDLGSVKKEAFAIKTWGLVRSANYGSKHIDEAPLEVRGVKLSADRKTAILDLPSLRPTMGMEIRYDLKAVDGTPISGTIHNTIHRLTDALN